MKIGYARVPAKDRNINAQLEALKKAGCKKIYEEVVASVKAERPILANLINTLSAGDTLVISKLDRLGRSLKDLVAIINQLIDKEIGLLSLNDRIDITNPHTQAIFISLAEFKRDITHEKTKAGLLSIRARGRSGGKPPGLSNEAKAIAQTAEALYLEQKLSVSQIAKQLGICKATLYAYLKHRKVAIGSYASKEQATQTEPKYHDNSNPSWHPTVD
ncbi:MAG: Resolvase of the ISThsp9 transposon of the Tn3 family [uncultured bacterium]|nr:MAG: Resolvase of the ISThsp9 transposon of the Tn3 family [uncultured bacterium]